jgi:hypothetical protein
VALALTAVRRAAVREVAYDIWPLFAPDSIAPALCQHICSIVFPTYILTFQPTFPRPLYSICHDDPRAVAWSPHQAVSRLRQKDVSTRYIWSAGTLQNGDCSVQVILLK